MVMVWWVWGCGGGGVYVCGGVHNPIPALTKYETLITLCRGGIYRIYMRVW